MIVRRFWAGLALVSLMFVPVLMVTQDGAFAANAPKAEWRAKKGTKAKVAPKVKKVAAPLTPTEPETPLTNAIVPAPPVVLVDQSQDVLDVDFAMASAIASQGPKDGYSSALSDEGVLYDANGASPVGREAATNRFGAFPADVTLVRTPERALAAGGSGSSWGTYTIKRGETILSAGRYISVWRRETAGWKMISELAAGKTLGPPPPTPISGILPKRPVSLARAGKNARSAPAAVAAPAASPPASEPPPAP